MAERTFRLRVGEKIRDLRKKKRVRQSKLARMVGISPGALTNFEKGRRSISLDWLQRIADTLDTPIAYFLPEGEKKMASGDPREKRLLAAWRLLGTHAVLRRDFLSLMEHLGARKKVRRRARKPPFQPEEEPLPHALGAALEPCHRKIGVAKNLRLRETHLLPLPL